jgi:hypothetical protein
MPIRIEQADARRNEQRREDIACKTYRETPRLGGECPEVEHVCARDGACRGLHLPCWAHLLSFSRTLRLQHGRVYANLVRWGADWPLEASKW